MSSLLNEVISRPGWRAGHAITLIMRQSEKSGWWRACNILSADYDRKYAPRLRLQLASTSPVSAPLSAARVCSVSVTVKADVAEHKSRCNAVSLKVAATATASDVPSSAIPPDPGYAYQIRGLYKTVLYKTGEQLQWEEARTRCSKVGSRLCRNHEVMKDGVPFFGFQEPVDGYHMFVPTEYLVGGAWPGLTVCNHQSRPYTTPPLVCELFLVP